MRRARMILIWPASACALVLFLAPIACQKTTSVSYQPATDEPLRAAPLLAMTASTEPSVGPSSVMVYIKMVVDKKYGLLAHVAGKRDVIKRDPAFDAGRSWQDNPLIAYADAPFKHADVIGEADAETIVGEGSSANVAVRLELVPHAVVTMRSVPKSDGVKGTITVSITTFDEYFDGQWTEMVRTKDDHLTFSFNTCDPARQLTPIVHETRTIPTFSVERYTRDREKWEPRSCWPAEFKTGDTRIVIYGKDATLDVTGYRYAEP